MANDTVAPAKQYFAYGQGKKDDRISIPLHYCETVPGVTVICGYIHSEIADNCFDSIPFTTAGVKKSAFNIHMHQ